MATHLQKLLNDRLNPFLALSAGRFYGFGPQAPQVFATRTSIRAIHRGGLRLKIDFWESGLDDLENLCCVLPDQAYLVVCGMSETLGCRDQKWELPGFQMSRNSDIKTPRLFSGTGNPSKPARVGAMSDCSTLL